MSDTLGNGRRIRVLMAVDHFSRVSPVVEVDTSLSGQRVIKALERAVKAYRLPKVICVDNGPEFAERALDQWAHQKKVKLRFSRPGKPTDNAMIETFNAKVRLKCLNQNWFESLDEAQRCLKQSFSHLSCWQKPRCKTARRTGRYESVSWEFKTSAFRRAAARF